jgi:hypothetical protein
MHPLAQQIASLQRRLLWRRRAAAACAILATAIAAAFVLGTADYVLRLADPGLRIMVTLVFGGAITWGVYRWWYVPSRNSLAPLPVARRIEQRFPQLHDSLASAVEFLAQADDDQTSGSAQLRRLVVNEAQNAVEGLPVEDVIDGRPLRRAVCFLAGCLLILAVCAVWDVNAVSTAFARLVAPIGSAQWPRKHYLEFRDVPTRLAAGQTFEVELVDTAGPLPDDVRIEYRISGPRGTESTSEPMIRAGHMMIARRENVRQSFAFRAMGGDDRAMRWNRVEVVQPPRLETLSIVVQPPAYTGLPPATAERYLDVLAGSSIEMRGEAGQPLSAARVLLENGETIIAEVGTEPNREQPGFFHVRPDQWIASKSGSYRIELAGEDSLAAVVSTGTLRVRPDAPPAVSWQRPTSDVYITSKAVVPIAVICKDDLGIQRIELVFERSDLSKTDNDSEATKPRIELYRGPEKPIIKSGNIEASDGETRTANYDWDLAPLQLPVGTSLILNAEAADYRPGTGRTAAPRRVMVISAEELETRLADHQAQIVRQLERALSLQQSTREDVRRLEVQLNETASLDIGDRNTLQSAELNQRRIKQWLVDPSNGAAALARSLIEQVEINRLSGTDLRESMDRLLRELGRLSAGPLGVAERDLLAAHKSMEATAPHSESQALLRLLSSASTAQEDIATTLERLIDELSSQTDYRRLARDLSELRKDQLAHADIARTEIGTETLPLQLNELTSSQRASLNKAAAGQNAIARRFEKFERAMDSLATELSESEEAAAAVADAVELARHLAIGSDMQESARDLGQNRVGQALAREAQIADELQQVIDALRKQRDAGPERLAENLREAEQRLAAFRQQAATLRDQLSEVEKENETADGQQLEDLIKEQTSLQRDIEQLAPRLDQLQAPDAAQSARSAASRLDKRAPSANQSQSQRPRPTTSADAQAAEQDLQRAAEQLANRRQQADDDLALEFIRRFQAELADMVKRQQQVIERTVEIDARRHLNQSLDDLAKQNIAKLAGQERELAGMAREHGELLFGLAAVRISLEDAERRLAAAAELLEANDAGPGAQQAERHALARLEGMFETFAQAASEAAPNNAQQPNSQAAQPGQPPQRRPTFELLEVKMLRMLQADLNERTRQYKDRVGSLSESERVAAQDELSREAQGLQADQGRLSGLVQEMLNRDNEERAR